MKLARQGYADLYRLMRHCMHKLVYLRFWEQGQIQIWQAVPAKSREWLHFQ